MEKSCGIICYDKDNRFLLIQHKSDGHWGIPKGHMDEGESEEETAIRELEEETAIKVKKIKDFFVEEKYRLPNGNKKTVIYFLGIAKDSDIKIQEEEILSYKWATLEEAMKILTYESSKDVIKKAYEFICGK